MKLHHFILVLVGFDQNTFYWFLLKQAKRLWVLNFMKRDACKLLKIHIDIDQLLHKKCKEGHRLIYDFTNLTMWLIMHSSYP